MIPNQRALFDIPDDVAYFNCAFSSPLLHAAASAGFKAIQLKQKPWHIAPANFFEDIETVRTLFAELISDRADNIAIIPATSYGIALAAKNLPLEKDQSIIVLQDQFPSNVYSWSQLARRKQATLKTIARPANNDWTSAVLAGIQKDTAIVALPHCHWTDGTLIDLVKIGTKCRSVGAALVVDATQSLGAMPFSVAKIQPDFLISAAHKWLLGPYSFGFCYVAPKWLSGIPLEENWLNRLDSQNFAGLVNYRDAYQNGARRYDVGAASNFTLAPIAIAALKQILTWGVDHIAATLRQKTDSIAQRARNLKLSLTAEEMRGPHILGISKKGGYAKELPNLLAEKKIFLSLRGESIRIAPHLYNTPEDIERLFQALEISI